MKKIVLIFLCFGIWGSVVAQSNTNLKAVDKIMLQIPESLTKSTQGIADYINSRFVTPVEKSRAIFIWVASNIQYDIASVFVIRSEVNSAEIIEKTLRTRKGVCINYANLFNDIALKAGLISYVVTGYTKQNGAIDVMPHAWCVVSIENEWYIFDSTWGSGAIINGRLVRQINNAYYKARPEKMIESHMPFDPLWQLLPYPITNQEFYDNNTKLDNRKQYFNVKDSLAVYAAQSDLKRMILSSERIEKSGVKNSMIFDQLQYNRREIEYLNNKLIELQYNTAVASFNEGVNLLNEFAVYYNNQFSPKKSDSEIQHMVDTVEVCFNRARIEMSRIKNPDANVTTMIKQLNRSINDATTTLEDRKAFLVKYFNTRTIFRKGLFYKFSNTQAPIN